MKTIILSSVSTILSATCIIGRNSQNEASKVRPSLDGVHVIPFYASRALSEINLISERCVGDASAASIPSDDVTERPKWGPVSSEAIDHRYRIQLPYCVSRGARMCVLLARDYKGSLSSDWTTASAASIKRKPIENYYWWFKLLSKYIVWISVLIIAINNEKCVSHILCNKRW